MFGRRHSEESRKKMSDAQKKVIRGVRVRPPCSEETKLKISLSQTGKKRTPEQIAKTVAKTIGKKRTPEQRAKISKALSGQKRPWHVGKNNPNWKGGVTKECQVLRSSLEYRQWRTAVFTRDNFLCVVGGKEHGNKLNADHIKAFASHPELRFDISNGRTLCEACHKKTDTYGRPTKCQ